MTIGRVKICLALLAVLFVGCAGASVKNVRTPIAAGSVAKATPFAVVTVGVKVDWTEAEHAGMAKLIDMPVGPTAKVRSEDAAATLSSRLKAVGEALGQTVGIHRSDGSVPVGRGIGPALEARDVLAVLRRAPDAPADLRERALDVAGALLDLLGTGGRMRARELLDGGEAETKFMAICAAQGGFREPGTAIQRHVVTAEQPGVVTAIDNRRIAKIAKLAGAPGRKTSGVLLLARAGATVERGTPLFEVHAETRGELAWALDYAASVANPFRVEVQP